MPTTTNYGWTTPADTDLVKDGASAIRTLGTAIDTTTKNLNPETTLGDISYRSSTANTNTRLALGTAGQVLKVNSGATAPEWGVGGGMVLISTTTLSGASVSLTSIPQTYKNLYIVLRNFLPATDNQYPFLRLNGDSGANRYRTGIWAASGFGVTFNGTEVQLEAGQDNGTSQSLLNIDIFDYTNSTTWKMVRAHSVTNNATTTTQLNYGNIMAYYNQTAAITSIDILSGSGNMTSGTCLLYGVA
jgi:hypothetical protein